MWTDIGMVILHLYLPSEGFHPVIEDAAWSLRAVLAKSSAGHSPGVNSTSLLALVAESSSYRCICMCTPINVWNAKFMLPAVVRRFALLLVFKSWAVVLQPLVIAHLFHHSCIYLVFPGWFREYRAKCTIFALILGVSGMADKRR